SFYTYEGFCKALDNAALSGFATEGSNDDKKREVAAFLANVMKETWYLHFIDQNGFSPTALDYHGRGPLQLTSENNYQACGDTLGHDLTGRHQTDLSTDSVVTWQGSICFWMTLDSGTGSTCHDAILQNRSFGGTIRIINGIECGGTPSAKD